jgi:hypothetical protein
MECSKERFKSAKAAKRRMAGRRRFGNNRYRQYFCEVCKHYHNTTDKQRRPMDRMEWEDE